MRELSYAVMDQNIHTPESGELHKALSNKPSGQNKAVKMFQLDGEVLVEVPSKLDPKKTMRLLIDNTRFLVRVLANNETNS